MSGRNISNPKPSPVGGARSDSELEAIDTGRVSLLDFPDEPLGFLLSFRWIPEKPDHGKIYWHINYAFTENFRAGIDYRSITGDVSLQANLRVLSENDKWRPALILGTANDDFGDISSQHYSATLSKNVGEWGGIHFSPYAGGAYIDA